MNFLELQCTVKELNEDSKIYYHSRIEEASQSERSIYETNSSTDKTVLGP